MDQHGGQSIANFDRGLAPGVRKTFVSLYKENLVKAFVAMKDMKDSEATDLVNKVVTNYSLKATEENLNLYPRMEDNLFHDYKLGELKRIQELIDDSNEYVNMQNFAYKFAKKETIKKTYQAMEGLIHNLNTMHSRAGKMCAGLYRNI